MLRRALATRLSLHRTLTVLALALATTTTTAHSQAPPSDTAQAAAAAKASQATAEGKAYAETIGTAFGREQAGAIQKCARESKRPDLSDFELLLRLDPNSTVREALTQPTTPLASCVASAIVSWKVPQPPPGQEWVSIAVQLKPRR